MYAAINYVRIGNALFTPGEVIDRELTRETAEMLLAKGAIRDESHVKEEAPKRKERTEGAKGLKMDEADGEELDEEDEQAEQEALMGNLVRGRRGKK